MAVTWKHPALFDTVFNLCTLVSGWFPTLVRYWKKNTVQKSNHELVTSWISTLVAAWLIAWIQYFRLQNGSQPEKTYIRLQPEPQPETPQSCSFTAWVTTWIATFSEIATSCLFESRRLKGLIGILVQGRNRKRHGEPVPKRKYKNRTKERHRWWQLFLCYYGRWQMSHSGTEDSKLSEQKVPIAEGVTHRERVPLHLPLWVVTFCDFCLPSIFRIVVRINSNWSRNRLKSINFFWYLVSAENKLSILSSLGDKKSAKKYESV